MGLPGSHHAEKRRLRMAGMHGAIAGEAGELWARLRRCVPAAPRALRKWATAHHRAIAGRVSGGRADRAAQRSNEPVVEKATSAVLGCIRLIQIVPRPRPHCGCIRVIPA